MNQKSVKSWEAKGWRFIRDIGAGGHGTIKLVLRADTQTQYALKGLQRKSDRDRRERLKREVDSLRRLKHPRISMLVDHNTEELDSETELYLVTEFIEGEHLGSRVKTAGHIALAESIKLISEILNTLEYCHTMRVIHRDIKPDNVMLSKDGYPVLIDFGLSYDLTQHQNDSLTGSQQGLANAFLRLPELEVSDVENPSDRRDHRSDLCLVVGLLFFMLTGREPRLLEERGKKPHERPDALKSLQERIRDPKTLQKLVGFFDKGFQVHPENRFQTAKEMNVAVYFLEHSSIPGLSYSPDILKAMKLPVSEGIEPVLTVLNPHRSQNVFVVDVHLTLNNRETQDVQDYYTIISVPRDVVNGSPAGQEPDVGGDFLRLRRPEKNQLAARLPAGKESRIALIPCKITLQHLGERQNRKSRCFIVEIHRRGQLLTERTFEFEEIGFLESVDNAT